MKKLFSVFILFFSLSFATFAFTPAFSFALGSGFDFYGDSAAKNRKDDFSFKNNLNLYAEANILFPVGDYFFFSAGGDLFTSFCWDGDDHFNVVDASIDAGMYFYPGVQGLMIGIYYSLAHRTDFIKHDVTLLNDDGTNSKRSYEATKHSSWGNGFKIAAEYDFRHTSRGFSPVLGTAWRFTPRGNDNYDNFLLFYVKLLKK